MVLDGKYTLKMKEETKVKCDLIGTEDMRAIIECNIEFKTDYQLKHIILESDIKKATTQRDKLLKDNVYYKNMIKTNNENITQLDKIIQSKNEELRDILDNMNKEVKEFDVVWNKIEHLVEENKFNELEIQEILENIQYNTPKQIIDNIIMKMKKENMDMDYINIVDNCL